MVIKISRIQASFFHTNFTLNKTNVKNHNPNQKTAHGSPTQKSEPTSQNPPLHHKCLEWLWRDSLPWLFDHGWTTESNRRRKYSPIWFINIISSSFLCDNNVSTYTCTRACNSDGTDCVSLHLNCTQMLHIWHKDLKHWGWKMSFLLGRPIFRCENVSFRGKHNPFLVTNSPPLARGPDYQTQLPFKRDTPPHQKKSLLEQWKCKIPTYNFWRNPIRNDANVLIRQAGGTNWHLKNAPQTTPFSLLTFFWA